MSAGSHHRYDWYLALNELFYERSFFLLGQTEVFFKSCFSLCIQRSIPKCSKHLLYTSCMTTNLFTALSPEEPSLLELPDGVLISCCSAMKHTRFICSRPNLQLFFMRNCPGQRLSLINLHVKYILNNIHIEHQWMLNMNEWSSTDALIWTYLFHGWSFTLRLCSVFCSKIWGGFILKRGLM